MPSKKIILSLAVLGLFFSFNLPLAKAMTAEEIQTKINDLLNQLQALKTQQGIADPLLSWCHDFTVNLKIGDSGTEVNFTESVGLTRGISRRVNRNI